MTNPDSVLEELIRFRKAAVDETDQLKNFNHDALCIRVSDQINTVLDSFEKYQHISYLVQGPRDQGVDVLLKHTPDDSIQSYTAFQIKSYNELEDRNNDLSKNLKAGFFDAQSMYGNGLKRYYIMLFGHSKLHFKRISALTNEFAKMATVRVITPDFLLTFLNLPSSTISAVVDRYLSDEDYVRSQARAEASGYSRAELKIILNCLSSAFENLSDKLPPEFFDGIDLDDDILEEEESVAEILSYLNDTDFEMYMGEGYIRIRTENFPAIRALYFDLQVRYEENSYELINHLFEFLQLETVS